MYKFVGVQRIDFVNATGEAIQGYSIYFLEKAGRGMGWVPFKGFLSDDRYLEMFGADAQQLKVYADNMSDCKVVFGRNNKLQSVEFPANKK